MSGLGRTVMGVGAGFIAAQASIAGVQQIMSRSIGAAMAFEHQLAQIRALTGATAEDTQFLSGAIKDMAREIPKSPAELGAGAYFILSSGIEDATEAAGVLKIAAKASTIGLGETEKVADALTTVINAYGLSASDAGHVTDVMIQAVKEGKAEADAFAGVLGRVVPLAAEMGISFEEVSANLATFTRLGVSAEEAATGLRSVMASLLRPTEDAREVLSEYGLSAQGVREQIREKGLAAVLGDLTERFSGNEEALSRLFPNIRALTSVLGTAGAGFEDYKDILQGTTNATGNLDEGFAIMADTTKFKVDQAMNDLNLTLMELGTDVLPVVVMAMDNLVSEMEDVQAIIGSLKGDVGDTNRVLDKQTDSWLDWTGVTQSASGSGIALGRALGGLIKDIAGVGDETRELTKQEKEATRHIIDLKFAMLDEADAASQATADTFSLGGAIEQLKSSIASMKPAQNENLSLLNSIAGARTEEANALDLQVNALQQEMIAAKQAELAQRGLGGAVSSATSAMEQQRDALDALISEKEQLAASLVPEALHAEIIALEHEMNVLQLGSAEIEGQILIREQLLAAHDKEVAAIKKEVAGLDDEVTALTRTRAALDKQIEAEEELAAKRKGTLPHTIRLKELELEKERILQRVEGSTDDLTDAERQRLDEIERGISAEQRSIRIKELEASVTDLQAQKSGEHLKALQDERREVDEQIQKTAALKGEREAYIDTLHPPELLDEIAALEAEKQKLDDQIAATTNLKTQRDLYIKTLMPAELEQEIDALERQRKAIDDVGRQTEMTRMSTDSATQALQTQIDMLNLDREAIDNVTQAWELQAEAMLGLPSAKGIAQNLKEAMLLMARMMMLQAIEAGDIDAQRRAAELAQEVYAFQPAQHGYHGTVTRPTLFLAAEAGRPERVDIGPAVGGGPARPINITFTGPILGDRLQAQQLVNWILPELRRAVR